MEYRKSYANKHDIYPKSLEDVVDVMRQVIPKKKKPKPDRNGNGNNGNGKNDQDKSQELESSNAQTTKGQNGDDKGEGAYYACGDKTC